MGGRAIVYAAGRGHRLGTAHAGRPKLMLRFGGRSLLEWHARRLAAAGVGEMVVVTGFARERVAAEMPAVSRATGVAVSELVNHAFDAGSVLSMAVSLPALEAAGEPLLLLDGDVLYPPGFLERLLASAHPSALLVDRAWSDADDDPVLVPLRAGRPFDFRKLWRGEADAVGESVGLFRLAAGHRRRLADETRARLAGEARGQSYDEVLRALVRAGCFGAEDVTGEPWIELDFPEDVARAEREVMPAILAAGG